MKQDEAVLDVPRTVQQNLIALLPCTGTQHEGFGRKSGVNLGMVLTPHLLQYFTHNY